MNDISEIETNLRGIQERIARACLVSNRLKGDVKLLAVSKTKPLSMIDAVARAGQIDFGENYVQEAVEKVQARPHLHWHFIGSLQTNKVKDVVGRFELIHSVDRLKLAREINKEAAKKNLVQDILLQVHLGDESTKHGFAPTELVDVTRDVLSLSHLRLCGLMGLPPIAESETEGRSYFRALREMKSTLLGAFCELSPEIFRVLSMGTTHDFEWAIAEGATHIRVGTAIFGTREPKTK